MMIHEITERAGRHKRSRRVGRGIGSGRGKTSGRGHNGARSRSGASGSIRAGREGGQMPFFRRIPKRGFSNARFAGPEHAIVNIRTLDARYEDGAEVNAETLAQRGLIPDARTPVKILGEGETTKRLTIVAAAFSRTAREKLEQAGGEAREKG